MFGSMKNPVAGTATLVSYTETDHGHRSPRVHAKMMLHAPGMEPLAVDVSVRIPRAELPLAVGEVWNVQFDRSQPSHVKFTWAVSDELDSDFAARGQQGVDVRRGAGPQGISTSRPEITNHKVLAVGQRPTVRRLRQV